MDWTKAGTILYMLLMVFYGIYTMVLAIQAYSKFSDSSQDYLNMAENLKQPYLTDITYKPSGCGADYTSLTGWNWQGTQEGCDCTTSSYPSASKIVSAKTCNSTDTSKGCSSMSAVAAVNFTAIQGASSTSPMYLCYKRADSSKSFYKIAGSQSGSCDSTQKRCGNPSIPSTVICVGSSESCPIYGYAISASGNTITYPPSEWTEIILPSSSSLYVNTLGLSATTLPLSELRFTQTSGVCSHNNNVKQLPSGQKDYILVKSTRTSCSDIDSTFKLASASIEEKLYYSLNLATADWNKMKVWPGFDAATSTELFKSYTRPFINWKVSERALMFDFVESSSTIKDLKNAQLAAMVIGIIVCLLVSIILSFSQVYNLCGKDVPCISGKGAEELQRIVCIKRGITYGAKLLQLPFLLWAFIGSTKKKDMLNSIADLGISDSVFNSQIKVFATEIEDNVFSKNMIALIILGITLLIDILLLIKEKCCGGSKKDEHAKDKKSEHKYDDENNHQQSYELANNQSGLHENSDKKDKKKKKKSKDNKHDGSSSSSDSDSENKKHKKNHQNNGKQVAVHIALGGGEFHPDNHVPPEPMIFGGMIPSNANAQFVPPPSLPLSHPVQPQVVNANPGVQFTMKSEGGFNPHGVVQPQAVNPNSGAQFTMKSEGGFNPHGVLQPQAVNPNSQFTIKSEGGFNPHGVVQPQHVNPNSGVQFTMKSEGGFNPHGVVQPQHVNPNSGAQFTMKSEGGFNPHGAAQPQHVNPNQGAQFTMKSEGGFNPHGMAQSQHGGAKQPSHLNTHAVSFGVHHHGQANPKGNLLGEIGEGQEGEMGEG